MDELFDKLFFRAISNNASDIHLILKNELKIYLRISSKLVFLESLNFDIGERFMNYLKYKAHIDTNYRLLPQTNHFFVNYDSHLYNLRISYLPSLQFESIVLRILNNHKELVIEDLTPIEDIQKFLYNLTFKKSGLFIISGITGSGKSTTLYTLLNEISKNNKNIITLEDPIEIYNDSYLQVEINEQIGITYASVLRQILRHDPDVIMIGEIRDEDTAKLAIRAALTGHLVLTTIHANNAFLALKRLLNLGISLLDIEDCLIGSLSLRMKYDQGNVLLLPELMKKKDIQLYIDQQVLNYKTFKDHALFLIENYKLNPALFMEELDE